MGMGMRMREGRLRGEGRRGVRGRNGETFQLAENISIIFPIINHGA